MLNTKILTVANKTVQIPVNKSFDNADLLKGLQYIIKL